MIACLVKRLRWPLPSLWLAVLLVSSPNLQATIQQAHGYAQFGDLKYPADFTHFAWANPDAPKGGQVQLMAMGTFDTLNPYTLKGTSPISTGDFASYGVSELNAPLMVGSGLFDPSGDEPASAYGLVAERLEYSQDRSWVTFFLRPQAVFHDGTPITAEDVEFSYRTLLEQGHPQYRTPLQEVKRVEVLSAHQVRFVFKRANNPLLILRIGELPILPKHYWSKRDFTQTTFTPPLGSGPYRISQVNAGKRVVFERVKNWWGQDLPVNRGKYNFDRVTVDFYRDRHVAFEAFKAGQFDFFIEHQAKNWAQGYDFPALRQGRVIKQAIPHQIPARTQAIFFNTRRADLQDIRVRQALSILFNFEWLNRSLFNQAYQRAQSYYPNSPFSASELPNAAELVLLNQVREHLPEQLFSEPFQLSITAGAGLPRATLGQALQLLAEAGWSNDGSGLKNAQGKQLSLEIMLVNPSLERILQSYVNNLRLVGVNARLRTVDRAQFKQRLDRYQYDLTLLTLPQTLSPGLEQWLYFHSSQAQVVGSKNYAGIQDPAVDWLLESLLAAKTREQQINATRALDRVLLWKHYAIPNWYINQHRLAYKNRFEFVTIPPYAIGLNTWWLKPSEIKP